MREQETLMQRDWSGHPTLTKPLDVIAAIAHRIAEATGDERAYEDPARLARVLTDEQATWLLHLYFPWLLWPTYQGASPTQERLAKGIADLIKNVIQPRQNPWSRRHELTVGQREEMEHTKSPRVARRIAQDHLREDPDYYEKLQQCGLIKPPRSNPSVSVKVGVKDRKWYEDFHGVPPKKIREIHGWMPGEMVLLGDAVDVGYRILDPRSKKEMDQPYEHEHEPGVKAYRRARSGEKPSRTWRRFPKTLRVLGYNIGFSYADKHDDIHEVKGSQRKYLATNSSGKLLVVVGPKGVEYVLCGGKLIVRDWIHG